MLTELHITSEGSEGVAILVHWWVLGPLTVEASKCTGQNGKLDLGGHYHLPCRIHYTSISTAKKRIMFLVAEKKTLKYGKGKNFALSHWDKSTTIRVIRKSVRLYSYLKVCLKPS